MVGDVVVDVNGMLQSQGASRDYVVLPDGTPKFNTSRVELRPGDFVHVRHIVCLEMEVYKVLDSDGNLEKLPEEKWPEFTRQHWDMYRGYVSTLRKAGK